MCVCSCATPIDPIEMRAFDPPVVRVRPSVVGEAAATLTDDPISSETLVATMPLFLAVLSVCTHYHYALPRHTRICIFCAQPGEKADWLRFSRSAKFQCINRECLRVAYCWENLQRLERERTEIPPKGNSSFLGP